ncbi:hypothetical protein [Heliophilum fasciatum]|uniref:Uncharacterized protein n=1 Tax=Heliophilum fasciatum TaxID=35700 RepID=A0A4R2RL80_9FIRM|nr:hypothetical protein [Heliophilum fasciatum]MCW2279271.1 hypothetical protein [Heliophilum fasciatum]TCP60481.1 hypothetical protein EDD73_1369 [Heliophilum fasciatum]
MRLQNILLAIDIALYQWREFLDPVKYNIENDVITVPGMIDRRTTSKYRVAMWFVVFELDERKLNFRSSMSFVIA